MFGDGVDAAAQIDLRLEPLVACGPIGGTLSRKTDVASRVAHVTESCGVPKPPYPR